MAFQPWQFPVGPPSGADDTPAINATLANAYNYAIANNFYAEIIFNSATYLLSGPTSTGTLGVTGKCKAQVPLPVVAATGQKVTLVFRGTREQSALYHFSQTTAQQSGAVLKTTLNASAQFAGVGTEPSVIGGPIPSQGYGATSSLFSNCLPVIDGITIQTPNDPQICGFDFRGMAEANVINGSCIVNAAGPGAITVPTQSLQFALSMPQTNNNDNCNVQVWSAQGQNYGIVLSEHSVLWSARVINCIAGLVLSGGGGVSMPHGITVNYVSAEACQLPLQLNYDTGNVKFRIRALDIESGSGGFGITAILFDPSNHGIGEVYYYNVGASTPRTSTFTPGAGNVNGGTGVRILTADLPRGVITPPSVPLSTTALVNGAGRDAMVTVATGAGVTVSAITVDGTATGMTVAASSAATVTVPAGKSITLTYAGGTPTWNWVLF